MQAHGTQQHGAGGLKDLSLLHVAGTGAGGRGRERERVRERGGIDGMQPGVGRLCSTWL